MREGSLEAPTRHPLDWKSEDFWDKASLNTELERVFDICHGCRRCVSLCDSFPTLFDLVDESETMEVDGVDGRHDDQEAKPAKSAGKGNSSLRPAICVAT